MELVGDSEDMQKDSYSKAQRSYQEGTDEEGITLFTIFNRLIAAIFFPSSSDPVFHRIKAALSHNIPLLRVASKNTAHNVLLWTRRGSPLRALLVVSVRILSRLLTFCAQSFSLVFFFFLLSVSSLYFPFFRLFLCFLLSVL